MKGDKGRQVNLSAWRAVPDIQANKAQRAVLKGDKGRQMNPSTQRAVPSIQAGRQRETNEGRQRVTNEPVHPEIRARHPGWETTGDK